MAKLTIKGQITVPIFIRKILGLKPGDEIDFIQEKDNIVLKKKLSKSPFDSYVGILKDSSSTNEVMDHLEVKIDRRS